MTADTFPISNYFVSPLLTLFIVAKYTGLQIKQENLLVAATSTPINLRKIDFWRLEGTLYTFCVMKF